MDKIHEDNERLYVSLDDAKHINDNQMLDTGPKGIFYEQVLLATTIDKEVFQLKDSERGTLWYDNPEDKRGITEWEPHESLSQITLVLKEISSLIELKMQIEYSPPLPLSASSIPFSDYWEVRFEDYDFPVEPGQDKDLIKAIFQATASLLHQTNDTNTQNDV